MINRGKFCLKKSSDSWVMIDQLNRWIFGVVEGWHDWEGGLNPDHAQFRPEISTARF